MKDYLAETASQTAGPYVHIGLAPDAAGFHIFENNFGPQLTTPDTEGERITFAAGAAAARTFPRASGALRPSSREPSSAAMAG